MLHLAQDPFFGDYISTFFSLFLLTFPKSGKKKFLLSPSQCPCLKN